ncbi:hypothetical protein SESBI_40488 [Sesbania bispinosa]|nr:hypothetical protein SESBI_40488 [Sesbania bispinosa]
MVEGNVMAEMRRIRLEYRRRNLMNLPPTNLTPFKAQRVGNAEETGQPTISVIKPKDTRKATTSGKGDSAKDPKVGSGTMDLDKIKKRDKSDSPKKPTNLEPPQKQQHMDGVGGSSAVVVPQRTSFPIPSMWDECFVFFREVENERQASVVENQSWSRIKNIVKNLTKTVAELSTVVEALKNEKFFNGLANKEKNALQKSNDDLKLQLKDAEDSYMEAKTETNQAKVDLDKALKELGETKAKLQKSESDLKGLNEKHENVVMKLGV